MSFPYFSTIQNDSQWDRFCDLLWFHEELGIWLDISKMKISSFDLESLKPKFEEAFNPILENLR